MDHKQLSNSFISVACSLNNFFLVLSLSKTAPESVRPSFSQQPDEVTDYLALLKALRSCKPNQIHSDPANQIYLDAIRQMISW